MFLWHKRAKTRVCVLLRHKQARTRARVTAAQAGTRALVTAAQACDGTIAMNWLVNGDHRKTYSSILAPGDF